MNSEKDKMMGLRESIYDSRVKYTFRLKCLTRL